MCELANELVVRGHDVEVYSLPFLMGSKPKVNPLSVLQGVPYHEAWTHKIDTDVAYTFYHPLSSLNFRIKGKKIASFHSEALLMRSVNPSYGLVPLVASLGTRVIGPLELRTFDAIHTHHPHQMNHPRTYNLPGWVDTNVFRPSGKKDDQFTVLFSGRALWQKGWDIYLALARRMKNLGIKFLYVGGAVRDEAIHSLGFQSSMLALSQVYNSSHVLMDPVRADTFGRVAVESMSCGTPVITSPSIAHKGLNLPFVFGSTLDEYEDSILEMRSLWSSGQGYDLLSQECRKAATAFDFKNVVSQYERMFSEVVGC